MSPRLRHARTGLLAALAFAFAAVPTASAQTNRTVECVGSSTCTTIAGPWVVVPPEPNVGALNQITAVWNLSCQGSFLIGSDWSTEAGFDVLTVWLDSVSGARIWADYSGVGFGAENDSSRPVTFQPLVGCSPNPPDLGRAASAAAKRVRRVTMRRLRPNRTRVYSFGCRPGERLVGSAHGIGFDQPRPPSQRELAQLVSSRKHRRGKVTVKVRTGPLVADDERVRLQIHALCRPRPR
jgi:hypothetical protein